MRGVRRASRRAAAPANRNGKPTTLTRELYRNVLGENATPGRGTQWKHAIHELEGFLKQLLVSLAVWPDHARFDDVSGIVDLPV